MSKSVAFCMLKTQNKLQSKLSKVSPSLKKTKSIQDGLIYIYIYIV